MELVIKYHLFLNMLLSLIQNNENLIQLLHSDVLEHIIIICWIVKYLFKLSVS